MYSLVRVRDTVRVPPNKFGENNKEILTGISQEEYEGLLDEDIGVVVAVTEVGGISQGKVVPGDGAAYYDADITMLVYKPEIKEVVESYVTEVTEFGAFVRTGPIEGLIHVSQIMDDYINYDAKLPGFIGKETNKKLQLKDSLLARIVTVSLKDTISNSKIGLTMRQVGLGKADWAKIDEKVKARKEKERPAPKGAPKGKPGKEEKK